MLAWFALSSAEDLNLSLYVVNPVPAVVSDCVFQEALTLRVISATAGFSRSDDLPTPVPLYSAPEMAMLTDRI